MRCIALQRGELTKLIDKDMDGKADVDETIYSWPLSGHYHEYSFGPKLMARTVRSLFLQIWHSEIVKAGAERAVKPWRGWIMHINPDGTMEPYATGVKITMRNGYYRR